MKIKTTVLFAAKLKAVLYARDKFLKPEGYILPDRGILYISGVSDDDFRENHVDWWKNVYGHDMSYLTDSVLKYSVQRIVSPNKVCMMVFVPLMELNEVCRLL